MIKEANSGALRCFSKIVYTPKHASPSLICFPHMTLRRSLPAYLNRCIIVSFAKNHGCRGLSRDLNSNRVSQVLKILEMNLQTFNGSWCTPSLCKTCSEKALKSPEFLHPGTYDREVKKILNWLWIQLVKQWGKSRVQLIQDFDLTKGML